ncbi:hypothetical protein KR054_001713, partial [Drosophila jambulina]
MLPMPTTGKREGSPRPAESVGTQLNREPSVTAPLRIERGRIAAEVDIGGHVRLATIDTGASRSFISQNIADVVGQPHQFREIRTQINLADTSRVEVTRLLLADVTLARKSIQVPLLVMPSMLEPLILGMDFLASIGTTLRCGTATLTFRACTAFTVPGGGLFQWRVMPFGLHSAPATFQRALDSVIGPDLDPHAFAYLDDIIRKIAYLGHVISDQGIHTDPDKVAAVRNLSPPTSLRELRRCLGMASWYRRFVPNFASVVQPMTNLLRKNQRWKWETEQQSAFDLLKTLLTDAPVLACPDFSVKMTLQTDASNYGLREVLTQEIDGQERVIAYVSRKLDAAELNYSPTEKECLAIVWGIRKLRCYLEGYRFDVITDHLALKWLDHIENPTGRIARWALELQQYQYDVHYRRGKYNVVADALSRQPLDHLQRLAQDGHHCKWLQRKMKDVREDPQKFPDFIIENGELYRHLGHRPDDQDYIPWKLCVAAEHRLRILEECHDAPTAGHLGVRKTIIRISQKYYWPGMFRDVRRHVRQCIPCQKFKAEQRQQAGKMLTRQVSEPFGILCADFVGPLPRSK